VLRALTDLKIIVSRGDDLSLRRAITYFLNNIAKQTQEQETIAAIGEDMFAVALDQPFRYLFTPTPALIEFALCSHMQALTLPWFPAQHVYLIGTKSPPPMQFVPRHMLIRKNNHVCIYSCCLPYVSVETAAKMSANAIYA